MGKGNTKSNKAKEKKGTKGSEEEATSPVLWVILINLPHKLTRCPAGTSTLNSQMVLSIIYSIQRIRERAMCSNSILEKAKRK